MEEEDIGGGCSQEANRCRCADESAQMATTLGNMTFLHQRFGSKRREGNSFGATFTSSGTSGWLMDTLRGSPRVLRESGWIRWCSSGVKVFWLGLLMASTFEETRPINILAI